MTASERDIAVLVEAASEGDTVAMLALADEQEDAALEVALRWMARWEKRPEEYSAKNGEWLWWYEGEPRAPNHVTPEQSVAKALYLMMCDTPTPSRWTWMAAVARLARALYSERDLRRSRRPMMPTRPQGQDCAWVKDAKVDSVGRQLEQAYRVPGDVFGYLADDFPGGSEDGIRTYPNPLLATVALMRAWFEARPWALPDE